jgi:hypothetical protein
MVQKGYGCAATQRAVRALKMVDLPEFGSPIMPQEKPN